MKQYKSVPEDQQENFIHMYWIILRTVEEAVRDSGDVLTKGDVEAAYRVWNSVTGDEHKAAWENTK